jgi:hypothetical protein
MLRRFRTYVFKLNFLVGTFKPDKKKYGHAMLAVQLYSTQYGT